MTENKFTGTGVALITPFRKDGSIDFNSLEKLVEHQISNGVDYLVVMGTTGEAATLTKDERLAVINYVAEVNNKRVPMVVGAGGNNTQEVVDRIKTYEGTESIDAILSVAPYYNKPNQKGIFLHYKTIAAASPVPIILYNVPGRTGVNISAETTLKIAHEVDNVVAIKEASGNLEQIMEILRDKPEHFKVISGDDALTFPMLTLGASGVISVVANAFPADFSEMVRLTLNNDLTGARAKHFKLLEIIQNLFVEGNPAGVKAVLDIMNIGPNYLRLPLTPVSRTLYNKLAKLVENY
ncbi:MAG: 4-hydroxy-tetrahydrodipicolinate synthase [Marinifilaceae bacterium]